MTVLSPTGGWVGDKPPQNFVPNRRSPQYRGLIAWWPLVEGANSIRNRVGNKGVMAFPGGTNNPTWITYRKNGRVLDFDGDDYLNTAIVPKELPNRSGNFTVSFWAARADFTGLNEGAIGIRQGTSSSTLLLIYPYDADGVKVFFSGSTIINQSSGTYNDQEFHLFTFVSESSTSHRMYVDGISVGFSGTSKSLPNVDNITIGAWHTTTQPYTGQIRDMRIYKRSVSTGEILHQLNLPYDLYQPILVRNNYLVPVAAGANIPEFMHHYQQQLQAG